MHLMVPDWDRVQSLDLTTGVNWSCLSLQSSDASLSSCRQLSSFLNNFSSSDILFFKDSGIFSMISSISSALSTLITKSHIDIPISADDFTSDAWSRQSGLHPSGQTNNPPRNILSAENINVRILWWEYFEYLHLNRVRSHVRSVWRPTVGKSLRKINDSRQLFGGKFGVTEVTEGLN